ncbi:endonuclease [Sulfurovum sp. XGS-02]|uniref:endonuclease/exonuclease/phosphatase family protein n=1 Tax=Sulfurovum sp. XGS-02 TaxID=2925411 RepID=UPI002046DDF3|nr:endonuclease/exonuclease/phosphatase family protein [Sulfurovum sp. XGS-02]UPT78535.1 endonuclease [Sulfurovum sp. XGS-02]
MKLRVGTFNLYQFVEPPYSCYTRKGKYNQRQWLEKTLWIKKQILRMDCDIIGFQEVFSKKALETLVKELGYTYFATVDDAKLSQTTPNKYTTTTVAIASKYPIANIQGVDVHASSLEKHHFKDIFTFSRVPIKAMIALPNGKELLVYVCHLKSNRLNAFEYVFKKEDTLAQKKERVFKLLEEKKSKALRQRLCEASSLFYDIQSSRHTPVVLMCDLNDKEYSLTIDALTNPIYHDDTNEDSPLLYDASYQYKEKVHNPHPEEKKPKRTPTSYFKSKGNVLDYIFISEHFTKENRHKAGTVSNYQVLDAHLQTHKDGSSIQSDHAQVVSELTLDI